MPKWPRRWSRSTGLRFPATVASVRLFGLSTSTTPPRTLAPSSHQPHVGNVAVDRAAQIRRADHVLPAAQVVGLANRLNLCRIGLAVCGKTQNVHADAVELGHRLPQVGVGIRHQPGCRSQHRAVQREALFGHGLAAQLRQSRWRPLQDRLTQVVRWPAQVQRLAL